MSSTTTIPGLDVSKDKLDACLLTVLPRTRTVPNTPDGRQGAPRATAAAQG